MQDTNKSRQLAGELRPGDELLWTAYQYSVGELGDSAAAAFEERMSNDPTACEALAEAVALGEVVRAAFERAAPIEPATRPLVAASGSRRPLGWWAIVTAAGIALAVSWQAWRKPVDAPVGDVAEVQRLESLAEADSQLLAALGPEHRWDAVSPLVDELVAADAVHEVAIAADAGDDDELASDPMDLAAPDWLLAAVAESSSGAATE